MASIIIKKGSRGSGSKVAARRSPSVLAIRAAALAAVGAAAGLSPLGSPSARATPLYWDTNSTTAGSGTSTGTWGTDSFWNTDSTGGAGGSFTAATTSSDDLFFNANSAGSTGTVTVSGTQSANTITLQTNVAVPLSGGTIALTSGGTNQTATAWNIGSALSLAGSSQTWSVNGAGAINLNGLTTVNASNTTLTRAGAGAGVLSLGGGLTFNSSSGTTFATSGTTAANTSTGAITFSSGTSAMTVSGSAFTLNGGITNSSANLQTINNNLTLTNGNKTIAGGAGGLTLGGTSTFSQAAAGLTFTGTVNSAGTFTVSSTGSNSGFITLSGSQTLNITGGTFSVNGTTNATKSSSIIGQNAAGTSTLNVNGGNFVMGSEEGFFFGNNVNTAIGVLNVTSGTITVNAGSTTSTDQRSFIALGRDNATGIINLDGGTLETGRRFTRDGSSGGTAGAGTATFNFNGGTLKALADQTAGNGWFETATTGNFQVVTTNVKAGGANINTNGFNASVNTVLAHDSGLGATPDGGLTKSGAGTLTLNAVNTYTGPTAVTGGNLVVGAAGGINGTSGVSVNGSGAKFVYAAPAALTPTVTVTNGTVAGTGTINTVNVADSASNHVANGNADTGVLTIPALTFDGAGAFDLSPSTTSPVVVTNTLTTGAVNNAAGIIAVNASKPLGTWSAGTYDLISYNTLGGTGFSSFVKGTIGGLTSRQMATLDNPAGFIALTITGDNPFWTGSLSGNWTTATLADPKNWKVTSGTTDFIAGDTVSFDDTAIGTTAVNISDADVTPSAVYFNNSTLNYTVSSGGGFAITGTGPLTKDGTGTTTLSTNNTYTGGTTVNAGSLTLSGNNNFGAGGITVNGGSLLLSGTNSLGAMTVSGGTATLNNANTYSGGTTLNSGSLNINHASAIGSGALTITGGTLDNTSGSPLTINGNAQNWNGDFTFNGSNDLNTGTGPVILSGNRTVTVSNNALIVAGSISGASDLGKSGGGKLILSGSNTYTGSTIVHSGELVVSGGTTGTLGASNTTGPNIQIAPDSTDNATVTVSGGTLNADRVIIAGNSLNNGTPGTGVLNQTGGTINSQEWFSVGAGATTGGNGTYNLSGGTLNVQTRQMEVANFTGATGTVTMSGSSAINIWNSNSINLGANNNAGNGTFTQNGGAVTFYSNGGTTVGGNGVLNLGGAGTLTSTQTYNLNGGTLTVPQIQRNAANAATAKFNFNGGTLTATKTNTTYMSGLTRANVRDGGAIINTNGFDVTVTQPLVHSDVNGDAAIDGGLTKNGAGALTVAGVATYTGATVINGGTLKLAASVPPAAVGVYSFDELSQGGLAGGTVVANTGTGGAAMNGAVNHADNPFADPSSTTIVAGHFGNALQFDGLGSSVDIPNKIVDQAGTGSWTLSAWIKTAQAGSALLTKNAGGSTWQAGHSMFYLGSNPIAAAGGNLPTAVRFSGGYVQGNQNVADDAWHMVTFVADAGVKGVYVDGVPVSLNFSGVTNADTATLVRLGFKGDTIVADGGVNFAGSMDEVKFFTGALTARQIQQLYNTNAFSPVQGKQYLPAATAVSMPVSGATLDLGDNSQSIGSLSGVVGSAVVLGAGTLTTGGDNTSTTFAGSVSGTGGLTKVGTGTWTLAGANTHTGGTTVAAGKVIAANADAFAGGALAVADGATAQAQASLPKAVTVTTLNTNTTGKFDVTNNSMVIKGMTDSAVRTKLQAGYNAGAWNGPTGIVSTAITAETSIGYATQAQTGITDFKGVTGLAGTDVLVKFTYAGDANLDGKVDIGDLGLLAGAWQAASGKVWFDGDFTYDGAVDIGDLGLLSGNWQKGTAGNPNPPLMDFSTAMAQFSAFDGVVVPEPASLSVLALGAAGLLGGRRWRRPN